MAHRHIPAILVSLFAIATPVVAQTSGDTASQSSDTVALALDEAVRRAVGGSQEVRLAQSQVRFAAAAVREARADLFPQITGSLNYTRTFESPIGGGGFEIPDSLRFSPDPTLPLEDRVRYLEDNATNAGLEGLGTLFGNLPFGQEHAYTAALSGSQTLFSPSLRAATKIAGHVREAAELGVTEQRAETELQVRSAYYRALLARELVTISEAAVAQAQRFLEEERLRLRAGTVSELEVLRAEVSLANLQPQLVEAANSADLAELDLKRLVDLPLTQPLRLTTPLALPTDAELAEAEVSPELDVALRAAVGVAERQVLVRRQQVSLQKASFLPTARLRMNYGGVLYPPGTFSFGGQDWRTDWNATVSLELPIFGGFRRSARIAGARAELEQAELQLGQLQEAVQLQYQQARGEKARARSAILARRQTVAQAQRVFELTELRYTRGLATQLEVSDARLALLQSRTNLAQALADFYVADAGVVRAAGGMTTTGLPGSAAAPTVPNAPGTPGATTVPTTAAPQR